MEKWKIKAKRSTKSESVLPPTRRPASPASLPMDKKKDGKWSFGGFLRKISSGQNNDVSSNEEDITYIPGHLLSKRKTKKTSKMKSKLGKISDRLPINQNCQHSEKVYTPSKETAELTRSLRANIDRSEDCPLGPPDDSVNSRSSEGSLDASGKASSRMDRVKARAKAKRDRLCGNSSSDDDSHKSSQSSMKFRSEDNMESIPRSDPSTRKTRGARTQRYIKRMFRDDVTSGSDNKMMKPVPLPRTGNLTLSLDSSNSIDSSIRRVNDKTKNFSVVGGSTPNFVVSRCALSHADINLPADREVDRFDARYLRDMNENETFERQKRTWPHTSSRRIAPIDDIHGSLQRKLLPPEPPPRSSRSRIFHSIHGNAPSNDSPPVVDSHQSYRRYLSPDETTKARYNSDNEIVTSEYVDPARWRFFLENSDAPAGGDDQESRCRYDNCNSLDRRRNPLKGNCASWIRKEYSGERENYDPRAYFENALPPPSSFGRSTYSLPKGVQLFSRQRLSHCGEAGLDVYEEPPEARIAPSPSTKSMENDDAQRKRSSKNLEEALSELEAIYNSLRLSDDDLLERAEQRSMDEYRDRAAKGAIEYSLKSCSDTSSNEKEDDRQGTGPGLSSRRESVPRIRDDMAYRRMNPKERSPSVNGHSSLSTISYLATSPNLSGRENNDCFDNGRPRSRRGTPDLTRDDLLYRSISRANNTLRVIDPQPPFGIPLGPVTAATESDYLHVKPSKLVQTRSLYIPKSEPDVVGDDLAFRNLRKDSPKDFVFNNNTNLLVQTNSIIDKMPNNIFTFGTKKKRAVRSMSADLYGIMSKETDRRNNDWYNDYIRSTQKLRFSSDDVDASRGIGKENSCRNINVTSKSVVINGLDINGNRPKSALQRKIQVYVPQGTSIDEAMKKHCSLESRKIFNGKPRDYVKAISTESEDSSPDRCDSRRSSTSEVTVPIESFTEQELSEYKQLCQDLEKLIKRTDEQEEDAEVAGLPEEHNSQSEFDELEKLLIDETLDAASTERDDDRSSSRSAGLGAESLSSDCVRSSRTKYPSKFVDDDGSSTSDLGNGSSNTASSLTDSVYDKFDKLLREVNDVPSLQITSILKKYPNDELNAENKIFNVDGLGADKSHAGNGSSVVDRNATNFLEDLGFGTGKHTQGAIAKAFVPSSNLHEDDATSRLDDSFEKPIFRIVKGGKRDTCFPDGGELSYCGEGEKIEDGRACNDGVYYACKDTTTTTTMHPVRKLCHVTNSITAYHIVMCSLFLTLLITIIVAQ